MKVPLTHGKFATIDDEDFELIGGHKWRYKLSTGYAVRSYYDKETRKISDIMMHRVINKTPQGFHTDHVNRDRLDNRKANLQTVTGKENTLRGISPPAVNAKKTHCMRGHEFTPENVGKNSSGGRTCIKCRRANWMKHYYLRKAAR